jgi:hypothetical protein
MLATSEEHVIKSAGTQNQTNPIEVLLDNQAHFSILYPSLLSDVRDDNTRTRVMIIRGFQMVVQERT